MKEVKRIDEFKDADGYIVEVVITFTDGSQVKYKAPFITREGNL